MVARPQHPLAKRVLPPVTPRLQPAEAPSPSSSLDVVSRPSGAVAAPKAASSPGGGMACPPDCYRSTDANVVWVNGRPYKLNRLLGKGGFGEVHEVELLLPYGLEVDWDESGNVRFNEDGCIMLNRIQKGNRGRNYVEDAEGSSENDQQCPSEAQVKSLPSSELPFRLSMTPSESMWFSLVGRNGGASNHVQDDGKRPISPSASVPTPDANHGRDGSRRPVSPSAHTPAVSHGQGGSKRPVSPSSPAPGGHGPSPSRGTVSHNPPCDFPVGSDIFLQGSGLFSALKLQSARNQQQLDSLVTEVENLRALSGEPGIVQLREHTINRESLYLIILMELGACDLHEFLKRSQYTLDVPSICLVWQTLVHRVESVHKADMIHRDIKAQNFILVPTKGYGDAKILARTSTRRDDFVFRLVQSDSEELGSPPRKPGDVELVITDPVTGREGVVLLSIKLTDFGIARTLEEDESHLSLEGPNGTVVFMAPEAVRQTESGCRKVSKRVDIWALGVMLYQMLHEGKTPFGHYLTKGGPPEVLLAIASETVNRKAMDFDASSLWKAERTRLWSEAVRSSWSGADSAPAQDLPRTTTGEMVQALVVSWVSSEFLVRVCKRCLTFDVNDRIDGADLRIWIDRLRSDRAIEASWTSEGADGAPGGVSKSELLQAAFNIDSNGMMQTVDFEVARIGKRIGASLFPEIWRPCQDSAIIPLPPSSSRHQHGHAEGSSSIGPPVRMINDHDEREFLDVEAGPRQPGMTGCEGNNIPSTPGGSGDLRNNHRQHSRFRQALALIAVLLLLLGGLCALCVAVASASSSSSSPGIHQDNEDSSSVPSTAIPVQSSSPELGSSITGDPGGDGTASGVEIVIPRSSTGAPSPYINNIGGPAEGGLVAPVRVGGASAVGTRPPVGAPRPVGTPPVGAPPPPVGAPPVSAPVRSGAAGTSGGAATGSGTASGDGVAVPRDGFARGDGGRDGAPMGTSEAAGTSGGVATGGGAGDLAIAELRSGRVEYFDGAWTAKILNDFGSDAAIEAFLNFGLQHAVVQVRVDSIMALVSCAEKGNAKVITAISGCVVGDDSPVVRDEAVNALSALIEKGKSPGATVAVLDHLQRSIGDHDPISESDGRAIDDLGAFDGHKVFSDSHNIFQRSSMETRSQAILALATIAEKGNEEVITVISRCMFDKSPAVRGKAVYALPKLVDKGKSPKATAAALAYLRSRGSRVSEMHTAGVVMVLGSIAERGNADVIEAIFKIVTEDNCSFLVRQEGVLALIFGLLLESDVDIILEAIDFFSPILETDISSFRRKVEIFRPQLDLAGKLDIFVFLSAWARASPWAAVRRAWARA